MNQLDKIFKDQLEHYQKPAPSAAWARVQKNIAPASPNYFWLKIAASLLLVAAAGAALWLREEEVKEIAQMPASAPKVENAMKEETRLPLEKNDVSAVAELAVADKKEIKKTLPVENKQQKELTKKTEEKAPALPEITSINETIALNENTTPNATSAESTENTVPADNSTGVTIVMSSQEINDKYLNKNSSDDEATSEEKKSSTFRKLLDKAYDLKHNQDPIGELRQKKNEILALNFKNDKRNENK